VEGELLSSERAARVFDVSSLPTVPVIPPLVAAYTSFNGDYINEVSGMCLGAAMLGVLPLNPEAALGYYVSTTALGSEKPEVMKACVAVQFKADEMWLVTDGADRALEVLSEGVRAEYLLWREFRPGSPVRHFPWIGAQLAFMSDTRLSADETLETALLSEAQHEQIRRSIPTAYRRDLDERLMTGVRDEGLKSVVFVSADPLDDKHLDWARHLVYESGSVAFCTSTILPQFVSDVLRHSVADRRRFRGGLVERADALWVFAAPASVARGEYGLDVRHDVQCWLRTHPDEPVRIVDWSQAEVPKFTSRNWALTEEEQSQVD
jgi:hypothetical protein